MIDPQALGEAINFLMKLASVVVGLVLIGHLLNLLFNKYPRQPRAQDMIE